VYFIEIPESRELLYAPVDLGHLDADDVEDGRHDVDRMVILVADLAARLDALGPGNDERIGCAAGVLGVALEHLERRRERGRPSRWEVAVSIR
jgi:hypothetical protein